MGALGAVAAALSVGFAAMLLAHLFYLFFPRKPYDPKQIQNPNPHSHAHEHDRFASEAGLVGSFGGYSYSNSPLLFFPTGSTSCKQKPSFLFTINEEEEQEEFQVMVSSETVNDDGTPEFVSLTPLDSPLGSPFRTPCVDECAGSGSSTPFVTPVSSPSYFTAGWSPPLTPLGREGTAGYAWFTAPSSPLLEIYPNSSRHVYSYI
ncbi:hypothetical protein AMTRI_Chr01g136160 [Amborella trichopoda]|uniref:Uncharacterized protein n=1 Tax=Amborella trichopoda TaxID=13333 RepID=W1PYN0_AMBTC|nr:hypothetical protein AMTR_s00025p00233640 [Amborella trichopoda]